MLVDNTSIIECLYPGCKLLADDEWVNCPTLVFKPGCCRHALSLIGKSEIARTAFTRLSINGFVESNRLLRWCPAADCGKAIKVSHCEARVVECSCKCRFCFECGHEWHEPVNCRWAKHKEIQWGYFISYNISNYIQDCWNYGWRNVTMTVRRAIGLTQTLRNVLNVM